MDKKTGWVEKWSEAISSSSRVDCNDERWTYEWTILYTKVDGVRLQSNSIGGLVLNTFTKGRRMEQRESRISDENGGMKGKWEEENASRD